MPFITPDKRVLCDKDFRLAEDKGDLCYLIYKELLALYKKEPRWTTIHEIYKTRVIDTLWLYTYKLNHKYTYGDAITALHLAWQVFFTRVVMPYEDEKERINGKIE